VTFTAPTVGASLCAGAATLRTTAATTPTKTQTCAVRRLRILLLIGTNCVERSTLGTEKNHRDISTADSVLNKALRHVFYDSAYL